MEHRPNHRQTGPHASHGPPHRDVGSKQTRHADGITWFLSKLQAEARADPDSELVWSVPTARADRAYNWGDSAIAPDAVGADDRPGPSDTILPSSTSCEPVIPRGVIARLDPYEELLLVERAEGRPAAVPRHSLRRGHRGGRVTPTCAPLPG